MNEMVERAAKALASSEAGDESFYDGLDIFTKAAFQKDARAVIAALREPTDAIRRVDTQSIYYTQDEIWRRMIDEALK